MTSRLYPDPPHLSATVYVEGRPGPQVIRELCRVVTEAGGVPIGVLKVAPADAEFDWVSDLADVSAEIDVSPQEFTDLVEGRAAGRQVIEAGFDVPQVGLVVVSYLLRTPGDRHPIAIITYADDLGIPEALRDAAARKRATRLDEWAHGIFRAACLATDPLYGELNIESTLSTPRGLGHEGDWIGDLYVADRLLAADDRLGARLRENYAEGSIQDWEGGLFATGPADPGHTPHLLARAVTKAGLRPYEQG